MATEVKETCNCECVNYIFCCKSRLSVVIVIYSELVLNTAMLL